MQININEKLAEHFNRVEQLANEAVEDGEEKFSSRAAAMSSVTTMLAQLTKIQEEVINMERLMRIEKATIDTLKAHLTPDQHEKFLLALEKSLRNV